MSYPSPPPAPDTPPVVTCYRHPDRRAGVRCQRCERPICPSCMSQASVGFQCPECVRAGTRRAPSYTPRTLPGQATPTVTWAIIALNVAAFVAQLATIDARTSPIWNMWSRVSEAGALAGVAVHDGDWWRLVTSGFLHVGILHIGMNMYVLYLLGPQVERLLGRLRYAALYLASLLAGSLGVVLATPDGVALGASGAIFGLIGAAAAYQVANRINIWRSGLGNLIIINLVITFAIPGISIGAHVGGLVGGGVVGFAMFQLEQRQLPPAVGLALGLGASVLFALTAIVAAPAF